MKKFNIKVDGVMHEVEVEEIGGSNVSIVPVTPQVSQVMAQPAQKQTVSAGTGSIVAPLQGTVQTIKVSVGDKIKEGDVVVVIEAMKMENDVPATVSGIVKNIYVSKGAKVSSGDVLIDIG